MNKFVFNIELIQILVLELKSFLKIFYDLSISVAIAFLIAIFP